MVHRPAIGACAIHAAVKPNGPRPPAPVFVVPPLASQLGMPPVTLDAERERRSMKYEVTVVVTSASGSSRRKMATPCAFSELTITVQDWMLMWVRFRPVARQVGRKVARQVGRKQVRLGS